VSAYQDKHWRGQGTHTQAAEGLEASPLGLAQTRVASVQKKDASARLSYPSLHDDATHHNEDGAAINQTRQDKTQFTNHNPTRRAPRSVTKQANLDI